MNQPKSARRFRFGPVDVAILLTILACLVGLALRLELFEKFSDDAHWEEAEISFLIQDLAPTTPEFLKIGDTFMWEQYTVGTLKSTEVYNAEAYVENDSGQIVRTEKEDRRDVRGIITAKGKMTKDGFMLNGTVYMAAGKAIYLKSPNIVVTVLITGIKVLN